MAVKRKQAMPRIKAEPITTANFIPLVHKAVATMPIRSVNGSDVPKDSTFSEAWLDLGLNVRTLIDRQKTSELKQKETDELLAGEKAKRALGASVFNYIKSMAWWQRIFIIFIIGEWIWAHGNMIDWSFVGNAIKHFLGS